MALGSDIRVQIVAKGVLRTTVQNSRSVEALETSASDTPCPQVESNHHLSFRRALLYPLEL